MECILAYDFGTSGVKAALVDFDGNLLGCKEKGYPLLEFKNGFVEQDPADYWNAVCDSTHAVLTQVGVNKQDVVGLSFSTQGMGVIPVDKDGNTLYNNISWVDARAKEQADKINKAIGAEVLSPDNAIPKYLWLKENMPELYEKTAYFLDCTGYLNYKATGVFCIDYSGKGPYHTHPEVVEDRLRQYEVAGLDTAKCPPLIPCAGYVGNVTEKAAEELGITTNAKVFMGVVDVTCAALGAGCGKEGDAHIYLGTSGWLSVITGYDRLQDTSPGVWQLLHGDPMKHIYGGCSNAAGLALDWTIKQFYHYERQICAVEDPGYAPKESVYDIVNREVANVPAGSEGLLATSWIMGEQCPIPDEKCKGCFIGATNRHQRYHFVNAMMEAVGYSLYKQLEYFRNDSGKNIDKLNAVGGGALSDHWMQCMANIFDKPVSRTKNCRYAGAIGSAAIVGVGLGHYKMDELDSFVQLERTFEPQQEDVKAYKEYYARWNEIYLALQNMFAQMSQA